jgi:hypothetical protein
MARVLATAGAALFVYAAFQPWLVITYPFSDSAGLDSTSAPVTGDQLDYTLPALISSAPRIVRAMMLFMWPGLIACGVLLAPLLWMRLSRRGTRLVWWAMLAWLVCALAGSMAAIASVVRFLDARSASSTAGGFPEQIGWRPDLHLVLVGLALALAALGLLALRMSGRKTEAVTPGSKVESAPENRLSVQRLLAAALFSTGVLAWALGFFALPWVTTGCAGLHFSVWHFVNEGCAGLDAADALGSGPGLGIPAIDVSISTSTRLTVFYAIAAGYSMLALAVVWRKHVSARGLLGIDALLLVVSAVAALAVRGVRTIMAHPPILTYTTAGTWVVGPGVAFAFAGLAGAWLGLLLLWRAASMPGVDGGIPSNVPQRETRT